MDAIISKVVSREKSLFPVQFARKSTPIVVVLHNLDCSGANMSALNVIQGLQARGFGVVLLSRKDGVFTTKFTEIGIAVRIGENLTIFIDEYMHHALCFICNTIMTCTEIIYIRSKSASKRSIWWLHEWWDMSMLGEQLLMRGIADLTVNKVLKTFNVASTVVFVCNAQKNLYLQCPIFNITAPCRSEVIYVGSTTSLDGRTNCERRATTATPFVFLVLGIVCPRKNQIWAVQLFKKFMESRECNSKTRNAKLVIVGARDIRPYETAYLRRLHEEIAGDPNIEVHNVTDDPDCFYKKADCLLFTSSNEVTPLVVSEAMAWGLPVLTTNIAGLSEMLDDGKEGFLFSLHDDDRAVDCMNRVYCDSDLRFKLGCNGNLRYKKQFDMSSCVRQWAALVHALCPPTVLVDMDGVIANWDGHFIDEWKKITKNTSSTIDRSKSYKMEDCVLPTSHRSRAQELARSCGFFGGLLPVEGALQALRDMELSGIRVVICTTLLPGSKYCAQEKVEWVREWLGDAFVEKMVISADKALVVGDILVDDRPIMEETQSRASWTQVIFSQPYNQAIAGPRLTHWRDWKATILPLLGMDIASPSLKSEADVQEDINNVISIGASKDARHSDSYESFDRFLKPNSPLNKVSLHKWKNG